MAASEAAIQVTLRCSDRLDEYDMRTFTLRPGAVIQVGRASKNTAKPELTTGPGNAYIDSPTISREHAVLTATSPPAPCVYITDKGSMHGTMVNGTKLEPKQAHRLSNGDVLQFGANVTRENRTSHPPSTALCQKFEYPEESQVFYTARSFTFESSLPSYPKGFSVPEDVESSDEEEIEVDEALSCPPRYGTQMNPVTIEDAEETRLREAQEVQPNLIGHDEFDDDELDTDLQDTTIPLDASENTQERSPSADVEDQVFYPEVVSTVSARNRYAFVDDASSEEDAVSGYSSEDDQASHIDSCASVAVSDESESDGDMELGDNGEEEGDRVVAPVMPLARPNDSHALSHSQMQIMLLEHQNKKRLLMARQGQDNMRNASVVRESLADSRTAGTENQDHDGNSELGLTVPLAPFGPLASSPSVNARKDEVPMLFTPSAQPASKSEPPPEPEVRMDPFFSSNGIFDEICFGSMDPTIPPRPAAPRPMQWSVLDYSSPFSPPVNTPSFPVAYSSDILSHYPGPVEPLLPNPYIAQQRPASPENAWAPPKTSTALPVLGVQTPPPGPSFEVSSPPVRRTEVSIREIVEDTVQQPPTPTSVTGGVKRKAEILDEIAEEADKEPSPAPQPAAELETNLVAQDAQTVNVPVISNAAIHQRPKKRLRSRFGSAVKTAAAWMVPVGVGAAATVTFLTSVPNDFFVA